jgi:hypothetical protein
MKRLILLSVFVCLSLMALCQTEKIKDNPLYITKDLVVMGINAYTTDAQLLAIRTNLLKYSTIRFTNFDVIRTKEYKKTFLGLFKKKVEGQIQFVSIEVDCRDGFNGKISHSFEKGDNDTWGFYRDYEKNSFKKSFFIGNLTKETANNEQQEERIKETENQ